jgi:hypothetical protein
LTTEGWMVVVCGRSNVGADGCEESTPVARSIIRVRTTQLEAGPSGLVSENLRSNAIRHTVDALASRGDEGRDKLR